MDQNKIGKFIAESRKKQGLTQAQLAEKLNITDRAVSKWENGKTMPDSSIMLELCQVLRITVNDLLNGEIVSPEEYTRKLEDRLMEATRGKERSDKMLLWLMCGMFLLYLLVDIIITNLDAVARWKDGMWILTLASQLVFIGILFLYAKVDQQAGYYRCKKCGYTHVPSFKRLLFISFLTFWPNPRIYCSQCKKKTRHKKVYSKD